MQLRELAALCGGHEGAQRVHSLAMAAIVAFPVVHVAMACLVAMTLLPMTLLPMTLLPKTLRAMIRGR